MARNPSGAKLAWNAMLDRLFPARRRARQLKRPTRTFSYAIESLEDRIVPAVFNVTGSLELSAAIATADTNGDSSNTIDMAAGIYLVDDQLIQPAANTKLTIVGEGIIGPVIESIGSTRDIEIGGNGASFTLVMQNLVIQGG